VIALPSPVVDLCAALGAIGGVEAVTIGGSRATGTADGASDWDVGLYYRGDPDFTLLTRYGELYPPGSWGRIMTLLGYLAGVPTYSLMAELALNRVVAGALPSVAEFPAALAETGRTRWRGHADFSMTHARMRAERGDVVGTLGQAAKAVLETAHAVLCERGEWVLNEKHMVERAGLARLQARFSRVAPSGAALRAWVEDLRADLEGPPGAAD
jgi:hypothetical protein